MLILDEPTAGLDPDGQERLLDVLAGLRAAGTTVVMATHDVDLAVRWADDAAVLTPSGVRVGPAGDLLSDPELLASAGLRAAWAPVVGAFLRGRGMLADGVPGPRTPEELGALG